MVEEGILAEWRDEQGFGFVEVSGKRYFLHISAVKRLGAGRPRQGDRIVFQPGTDAQGRPRALAATIDRGPAKASPRRIARGASNGSRFDFFDLLMLILLPVAAIVALRTGQPLFAIAYALFSAIAVVLYWHDKHRAVNGGRRVPESTLQIVALLGGWPGAWIAQHLLRHKSRKASFRAVFVASALLNVAGLAWLSGQV
ncbi:DUF1294 domain-containing protein [Chitiniphilus eburneus]|uniref:DUF1294 domain-containing protein n=1 Tax=Chitiniphilus eburneus TaxID=2571148 RepID=A0A4U0QRK1_9NEIS|nr:DUF1294 domain-containing protein [Chitiniphilus eburneus]TJZ78854.1 DUF1294 domain-containing protein [Chitiniphilus eburneus]